MNNFWNNLNKYPRFLLSVLVGFFLTTLHPIFKLFTNKKNFFFISNHVITYNDFVPILKANVRSKLKNK
uniref:Uncharacterized protein ycf33 n=1 Tax=Sebdenia flabellata TaxID=42024 RepID=A0A1C9CA59_9FLOR|nr:hypothetical protein Sebd_167 [Sebdenia flabellata]AOM65254.1 hypothetical protein Sebd_167 [Sebdenia flabellata]